MSGDNKTEKPTPRKLSNARKEGMVAKSSDMTSAIVSIAMLCLLAWYGNTASQYLMRLMRNYFSHPDNLTTSTLPVTFQNVITHMCIVILPFLLTPMIAGIAMNLFQVKPMITFDAIKPKFKKINPLQGIKRLVSQRSLIELAKGLIKLVFVGTVAYWNVSGRISQLMNASQMSFLQAWELVYQIVLSCIFAICIAMLCIGAADWFYQKWQFMKQMRMTKQEVKDEMRNMEGNPEVKQKIKANGRQIATRRIIEQVKFADVILINPTHYSVALQYDPDIAPAPRVVAKGTDHLALRIREEAKTYGIPLYENPPLARQLYAMVEMDHLIPPELFIAVAEVLAFVFQKSKGRKNWAQKRAKNSAAQQLNNTRNLLGLGQ